MASPGNPSEEPPRATCARCSVPFDCEPGGDCWCMRADVRVPMPAAGESCVCPDCLQVIVVAHSAGGARD